MAAVAAAQDHSESGLCAYKLELFSFFSLALARRVAPARLDIYAQHWELALGVLLGADDIT